MVTLHAMRHPDSWFKAQEGERVSVSSPLLPVCHAAGGRLPLQQRQVILGSATKTRCLPEGCRGPTGLWLALGVDRSAGVTPRLLGRLSTFHLAIVVTPDDAMQPEIARQPFQARDDRD